VLTDCKRRNKLGRQDRERIQRIIEGKELPRAAENAKASNVKMLLCKNCGSDVPAHEARVHIQKCWGLSLLQSEPIPTEPRGAYVKVRS
jgi:hypothetical protein